MELKQTVILLAEDEAVVRNLVRLMLEKEGYALLTANDGQEALEISEKFADPIHLLLTEVQMPQMNGLELAERVREQRPYQLQNIPYGLLRDLVTEIGQGIGNPVVLPTRILF